MKTILDNLGIVIFVALLGCLLWFSEDSEPLKVVGFVAVFVVIKFAAAYANILLDRRLEDK